MVEYIPHLFAPAIIFVLCIFLRISYVRGFNSGIDCGKRLARKKMVIANSPVVFGRKK